MILWILEISFATLKPLEPTPHRESTKIRFFLGIRRKFLYIKIEISLLNFAAGLKKAGNFEGSFWISDREGTSICVIPSFTSVQDWATEFCCRIVREFLPNLFKIVYCSIVNEISYNHKLFYQLNNCKTFIK